MNKGKVSLRTEHVDSKNVVVLMMEIPKDKNGVVKFDPILAGK